MESNLPLFSNEYRENDIKIISKNKGYESYWRNDIQLNNIHNIEEILKYYPEKVNHINSILDKYFDLSFDDYDKIKNSDFSSLYRIYYNPFMEDVQILCFILAKRSNFTFWAYPNMNKNYFISGIKLKTLQNIPKITVNPKNINHYILKYNIVDVGIYVRGKTGWLTKLLNVSEMQNICDDICDYYHKYSLDIIINEIIPHKYFYYDFKQYRKNIKKRENEQFTNGQFILACLLLGIEISEPKKDNPNVMIKILQKSFVIE